jgi:hypothetical protein
VLEICKNSSFFDFDETWITVRKYLFGSFSFFIMEAFILSLLSLTRRRRELAAGGEVAVAVGHAHKRKAAPGPERALTRNRAKTNMYEK